MKIGDRVTLVILSFNQEEFIADAIRGALSQEYPALDIIVCDDCSTDSTVEKAAEIVDPYRGPHRVSIVRNESNLGLIGNLQEAFRLADTDIVICAAGDDIPTVDRVAKVAEAFSSGHNVKLVASDFQRIDATGKFMGRDRSWGDRPLCAESLARIDSPIVFGCAVAYSKDVVGKFQLPAPDLEVEDAVYPFRALLLGEGRYIPEPLVLYRQHTSSMSASFRNLDDPNHGADLARILHIAFCQHVADLDYLTKTSNDGTKDLIRLKELCEASLAGIRRRIRLETPGFSRIYELILSVASGETAIPMAIKTALRVNAPRFWAWYVRWRRRSGIE